MKLALTFALALTIVSGVVAQQPKKPTSGPVTDSKPPLCPPNGCALNCPPNDPNGCGILD